jgi:hypothetical protein
MWAVWWVQDGWSVCISSNLWSVFRWSVNDTGYIELATRKWHLYVSYDTSDWKESSPTLLPTLSDPQPSEVSPQNNNLSVLPPLLLPSEFTPEENSLQFLAPLRTHSMLTMLFNSIDTPLPIHIHGPSTFCHISVPKPTRTAANIDSVEDTSFSLSLDASDGEFRCFFDQNSSFKPRARHCLLNELNLSMSELTPRQWELYHRFQRKESVLCKMRKKYRSRKLKDVMSTMIHWCRKFQILWMQRVSGYWQQLLGIVDTSWGEGCRILKTKFWFCLPLSIAQNPILFIRCCSLFQQDKPCIFSSVLFILGQASIPMCWMHFTTVCRKCVRKIGTVVACLMKC